MIVKLKKSQAIGNICELDCIKGLYGNLVGHFGIHEFWTPPSPSPPSFLQKIENTYNPVYHIVQGPVWSLHGLGLLSSPPTTLDFALNRPHPYHFCKYS